MRPGKAYRAFNLLAKWRTVFTSWQLGTRSDTDAEAKAVKDHRELSILLRAEVTGITRILLEKGVVTEAELDEIFADEAEQLSKGYERRFPGYKATEHGMAIDVAQVQEHGTMDGWPP